MTIPSLEDLAARVAALEEREAQLLEQLQELQQEARVKAVAWQLDVVHEKVQAIQATQQEHGVVLAAHGVKLEQIDERMETGFNGMQGALDEILGELRNR